MGLLAGVVGPVSKVLARFHHWYATAWLLGRLPLGAMDSTSLGRLRYALMMANKKHPAQTRRVFEQIVQRNGNSSPELLIELAVMATVTGQTEEPARLLRAASLHAKPGSETADAAQQLLRVDMGIADDSLQAGLHAAVDALALPAAAMVTLVPVSGKYLELWQLWLEQVRRHIGPQIVAMAMDNEATAALSGEPGVAVIDVREFFSWDERGRLHPHTRGVLWYLRVLVLQGLVLRGHPTLVLDLDAMPLNSLTALWDRFVAADVVAQKDHSIPMDVDRELGFVLCCGFMFWRPTAASVELLQRFAAATATERDDQLALNHLLAANGIQARRDGSSMSFEFEGVRFACPDPADVSRNLHSGAFVRHFHQQGESVADLRAALAL